MTIIQRQYCHLALITPGSADSPPFKNSYLHLGGLKAALIYHFCCIFASSAFNDRSSEYRSNLKRNNRVGKDQLTAFADCLSQPPTTARFRRPLRKSSNGRSPKAKSQKSPAVKSETVKNETSHYTTLIPKSTNWRI